MFVASQGNCDFSDYDIAELTMMNEKMIIEKEHTKNIKTKYIGKNKSKISTKSMDVLSRRNVITNYARFIMKASIIHQCLLRV